MTKRLAQLLAVERSARQQENEETSRLYRELQKPGNFAGLTRTYKPLADDGDPQPPQSTQVQMRAAGMLEDFAAQKARLLDLILSKDTANTVAKADLSVDGTVLAAGLPGVTLLAMEKQCNDVIAFVKALPVLDPSEVWAFDANADAYRSEPSVTTRSTKETVPLVLWAPDDPATSKHPAQVDKIIRDVPQGNWTVTNFSGAIPADRKRKLLERALKLRDAVHYAREEANRAEVAERPIGQAVFAYLLAE